MQVACLTAREDSAMRGARSFALSLNPTPRLPESPRPCRGAHGGVMRAGLGGKGEDFVLGGNGRRKVFSKSVCTRRSNVRGKCSGVASVGPLALLRICSGSALVLLWSYSGATLELFTSEEGVTPEGGTRADTDMLACKVGPASYRVVGRGHGWEAGVWVSVAGACGGHVTPVMLVW